MHFKIVKQKLRKYLENNDGVPSDVITTKNYKELHEEILAIILDCFISEHINLKMYSYGIERHYLQNYHFDIICKLLIDTIIYLHINKIDITGEQINKYLRKNKNAIRDIQKSCENIYIQYISQRRGIMRI